MELNRPIEDYIENRFHDLVANINQDSDELFDSLLSSNNINFTRSRTCLMDDFQLHQATPLLKSSVSMNPLNSTPSKSKSRTSLQNDLSINIGLQTNNRPTTCPWSSKTPLKPISSNTLNHFKPRTSIEKCSTTYFSSQRNQVYQSSESSPSPCENSLQYNTNDDSHSLSEGTFHTKTPTNSPHGLSVQKYSSFKLDTNETDNSGKAVTNGRLLKSCLKEKHKEAIIPGSPAQIQYITFRNKSSQKKVNCMVSSCNTVDLDLTDEQSMASKFNFVSACNSSPIPATFKTIKRPNQQYNLLKTPVGRCSQPFLKTPNSRQLKEISRSRLSNNNTPTLSCKTPKSSKSLTGVKKLQSSLSKRLSLQPCEKELTVNKEISFVEDDDLPCTQPISEIILRGKCRRVKIFKVYHLF